MFLFLKSNIRTFEYSIIRTIGGIRIILSGFEYHFRIWIFEYSTTALKYNKTLKHQRIEQRISPAQEPTCCFLQGGGAKFEAGNLPVNPRQLRQDAALRCISRWRAWSNVKWMCSFPLGLNSTAKQLHQLCNQCLITWHGVWGSS